MTYSKNKPHARRHKRAFLRLPAVIDVLSGKVLYFRGVQYCIVAVGQQGRTMALDPIKVTAAVNKVQTLADGGLRWTFDLPETAVLASAHLMEIRRNGVPVELTIVPTEQLKKQYGGRLK